jgi:hypothetical protein
MMPNSSVSVEVADLFETLKSQWKSKTRYMSNSAQIAMVWEYQQIIGIGRPALPFILAELEHETDHWFWALEAISGENPVPANQAGRSKTWRRRGLNGEENGG